MASSTAAGKCQWFAIARADVGVVAAQARDARRPAAGRRCRARSGSPRPARSENCAASTRRPMSCSRPAVKARSPSSLAARASARAADARWPCACRQKPRKSKPAHEMPENRPDSAAVVTRLPTAAAPSNWIAARMVPTRPGNTIEGRVGQAQGARHQGLVAFDARSEIGEVQPSSLSRLISSSTTCGNAGSSPMFRSQRRGVDRGPGARGGSDRRRRHAQSAARPAPIDSAESGAARDEPRRPAANAGTARRRARLAPARRRHGGVECELAVDRSMRLQSMPH